MADKQSYTDEDLKNFSLEDARVLYEKQVEAIEQMMKNFQSCRELIREVAQVNVRIEELCALRRKAMNPGLFSPPIIAAAFLGGVTAVLSIAFLAWVS